MLEKEYASKAESYYAHERHEMLKYIPQSSKLVLDVGCSSGAFGKLVKTKYACEVWGIEPDKKAANNAQQVLDKVYNTVFDESVDLEGKLFDCIIFNDVLEHIPDPFYTLEFCKKYLNKNGTLICSIPNIRYFDAMYHIIIQKDFKYVDAGIFDKTHLRFFTKKSILRMFTQVGYDVVNIEGINSIREINMKGYKNFKLLNRLLFDAIEDMEFLQFAIVARVAV